MIPTDKQAVENETSKDKFTRYLKSIFDTVKMTYALVVENNELLKKSNSTNSGGTVTYEGMLNYIAQRPMWKLTDKQIYYMVERGDDIRYIQAVSGYKMEDIKKKYEQHKKNNVYR